MSYTIVQDGKEFHIRAVVATVAELEEFADKILATRSKIDERPAAAPAVRAHAIPEYDPRASVSGSSLPPDGRNSDQA